MDELTTDGVRLEKHVEREELPLPSIVYDLTNERAEELRIRFVELIPEAIGPEHIGFPSEERDAWRVDDGRIVHETTLEADSSTSAAFGLRPEAGAGLDQFRSEPETVEIWTPLTAADGGEGDATDSAASVQPHPPEETPDPAEPSSPDPAEPSSPDPAEPSSPRPGNRNPPNENGEGHSLDGGTRTSGRDASAERPVDGAAIVGAVVDALRSGDVPASDLASLREELAVPSSSEEADTSASVDARIRALQSELADLRAYRAALEEFLDEEGTATEVVDRIDSRLDSLGERLNEVETSIERLETSFETLESTVASQGDAVETNEAAIEANVAAITSNEDAVAGVEADVEGLSTGIADIESRLDTTTAEVDSLSSALARIEEDLPPSDITERVDDIAAHLDAMEDETEAVADRLETVDHQVGSLRDRVAENEGELSQVRDLERKLEQVFGTGAD